MKTFKRTQIAAMVGLTGSLTRPSLPTSVVWAPQIPMIGSTSVGEIVGVGCSSDFKYLISAPSYPYSNPPNAAQLAKSSDGGATWVRLSAATFLSKSDAAISDDGQVISVTGYPGFSYSLNGGASFVSASSASFHTTVVSGNGKVIAAVPPSGAVLYTPDAGASWKSSPAPLGAYSDLAVSYDGSRILLLDNQGNHKLSSNGGATWASVPGLSALKYGAACAMSLDGSVMLAVGTAAGAYKAYRSTDFGVTWSVLSVVPPSSINKCCMSPNGDLMILQSSTETLKVSLDRGATWASSGTFSSNSRAVCAGNSKILVGCNGWLNIGTVG